MSVTRQARGSVHRTLECGKHNYSADLTAFKRDEQQLRGVVEPEFAKPCGDYEFGFSDMVEPF